MRLLGLWCHPLGNTIQIEPRIWMDPSMATLTCAGAEVYLMTAGAEGPIRPILLLLLWFSSFSAIFPLWEVPNPRFFYCEGHTHPVVLHPVVLHSEIKAEPILSNV